LRRVNAGGGIEALLAGSDFPDSRSRSRARDRLWIKRVSRDIRMIENVGRGGTEMAAVSGGHVVGVTRSRSPNR
jgi:hypothetical protein